jgi:hypothetical protein
MIMPISPVSTGKLHKSNIAHQFRGQAMTMATLPSEPILECRIAFPLC